MKPEDKVEDCPRCGHEAQFVRVSFAGLIMAKCDNQDCPFSEMHEFDVGEVE